MIVALISIGCAVAVVGIDQLTKFLIYGTAAKSIIGNFLWFESTLNTGVAFSMFEGKTLLFIIVSALASLVLLFLIFNKKVVQKSSQKICLGFILGGTIGNLIDRIVFDGVRDFIYLKFINFAIFNVADMAIVCSVIVFCVFLIIDILKKEKK